MPRVVVVGAGLAGLAAADALGRTVCDGPGASVVLVEAAARAGGLAWTEHTADGRYEWGPEGWFPGPELGDLVGRLGLPTVTAAETAGGTRLALRGRLRPLPLQLASGAVPPPTAVAGLVRHGVLGPAAVLRMSAEPLLSRRPRPTASLGHEYRRRLGAQATQRLVAPFAEGVLGSPPDRLAASVMPPPVGRSLVLASLWRPGRSRGGRPGLTAPTDGMSALTEALAGSLADHVELQVATAAREVTRRAGRFVVVTDRGDLDADAVVVAVPPPVASVLVTGLSGEASSALAGIAATTSAVVQVDAPADQLTRLQTVGSGGWLGAPEELPAVSAGSFAGLKWPQLGAPTRLRLVVRRKDLIDGDDADLVDAALDEVRRLLGVDPRPETARVHR